jgi:hypothetical protein
MSKSTIAILITLFMEVKKNGVFPVDLSGGVPPRAV